MVRNTLWTIAARRAVGLFGLDLENKSPFYGLSSETRQQLIKHVKEWSGPRVKMTKRYKELSKARDGMLKHPMILGGCDKLARRLESFCKYNRDFLAAEKAHALREESKRRAVPRETRVARGDLAEVRDLKRKGKNKYLFKLANPLPVSHRLNPGQIVNLRETLHESCYSQEKDLITVLDEERGIIVELNQPDAEIVVDFSDESDRKDLQLDESENYEIDVTFDTVQFDRCEKTLENLAATRGALPLWAVILLETYLGSGSCESLRRQFRSEVEDIYDIMSAHRESELVLSSEWIEDEDDYALPPSTEVVRENLKRFISSSEHPLNPSQQSAVTESLRTYLSLIQGPPGTGKTHTAAAIVKMWLESRGKNKRKVLVVAQSNKAVDQLCSAMLSICLDPVRVGTAPKLQENTKDVHVNSKLQELVESIQKETTPSNSSSMVAGRLPTFPVRTRGYAKTMYSKKQLIGMVISRADIICSTCIGSLHAHLEYLALHPDKIGLIVLDEASQASELECLVPLTAFPNAQIVMIGDHKQLPPTIISNEARKGGKEYSVFSRLIECMAENESVCGDGVVDNDAEAGQDKNMFEMPEEALFTSTMLREQYRMHPEISKFPNQQFYGGLLLDSVSSHQRPLPSPAQFWPTVGNGKSARKSCVAFIPIHGKEDQTKTKSFSNAKEVAAVVSIAKKLLGKGLYPKELGVISPYTGQVVALKHAFAKAEIPFVHRRSKAGKKDRGVVEVNSVDAFQGSEKEVIIISTVRANENGSIGFLKDMCRMNVALTRAKRGIIVVGDPVTMDHDPQWSEWLQQHKCHHVAL